MIKILVVDDSEFICAVVQHTLSSEQSEVLTAYTAKDGVEAAQKENPDLILMDVSLPDMNGFMTCTLLKQLKETSEIPIVFITGHDSVEDIVKGFEAGAVDYIRKPFEAVELKARAETHLKNKLMSDRLRRLNEHLLEALEENRRLAEEDPLTGLYNRRYGLAYMEKYQEAADKEPSMLIMGDVDDFKEINDNYGHYMGDEVLCRLSKILKEEVGNNGIACRWGGEEVLIVLHQCCQGEIKRRGQKICDRLHQEVFCCKNKEFNSSITLGAVSLNCEVPIEHLIRLADEKLYQGKRDGKNCCVY